MKADRVIFEEPSESEKTTPKAGNGFLCKNLMEKGQIFATVPSMWFLWIVNVNSWDMRLKLANLQGLFSFVCKLPFPCRLLYVMFSREIFLRKIIHSFLMDVFAFERNNSLG